MLRGGNAREVVQSIKDKIDEIHEKRLLPDGLRIIPFYDRIELITAALDTVYKALLEGIVLVVVILFLFLGNVRSALIVTATLIVTPLVTFIVMDQIGPDRQSRCPLGGLVIAIGMMVDGSVVVVENVYRHLAEQRDDRSHRTEVILQAVTEVGQPVIFGILIIVLVFLPILTLQGMEGKMFQPMANTIIIALVVSLVLSLTLSPVLCALSLKREPKKDTFLLRWAKRVYLPTLQWAMGHRLRGAGDCAWTPGSQPVVVPFLGGEFIPILNEGAISPQTIRYPSIALNDRSRLKRTCSAPSWSFPKCAWSVSKIGRSEMGNDPQEPNASDPVVVSVRWTNGRPPRRNRHSDDAIRKRIEKVPGANFLLSQPIQQRVDELLSGVRSEATIKILGDDLAVLRSTAEKIQAIMASVKGVGDVRVEQLFGQTYLTIDIDRGKISRYGINVAHIQEIITTAIGQEAATRVYEGNKRFDLTFRYPENIATADTSKTSCLTTPTGALVPLGDLATIELREGPSLISREGLQRRIYVGFNTLGRDIESVVAEAQAKIAKQIHLPAGYHFVWGGSFENMQRAMARSEIILRSRSV